MQDCKADQGVPDQPAGGSTQAGGKMSLDAASGEAELSLAPYGRADGSSKNKR